MASTGSSPVLTSRRPASRSPGFHEYLKPGRVLIFGESEIRYLESLEPAARIMSMRLALTLDFPCVLITGGFQPPVELIVEAERARAAAAEDRRGDADGDREAVVDARGFARRAHDDARGARWMSSASACCIVGESGIGKSECALDLIVRGHRLVADDTVELRRRQETILIGTCPELTRHHMELRGLGVINVMELFGIASTRSSKRVELVVQLERWDAGARVRAARARRRISSRSSGCACRCLRMPVAPGRNIAILVEVAARNQLLRVARASRGPRPGRSPGGYTASGVGAWPPRLMKKTRKSGESPTCQPTARQKAGRRDARQDLQCVRAGRESDPASRSSS